jgi:hypothetical protein
MLNESDSHLDRGYGARQGVALEANTTDPSPLTARKRAVFDRSSADALHEISLTMGLMQASGEISCCRMIA